MEGVLGTHYFASFISLTLEKGDRRRKGISEGKEKKKGR